MARRRGDDDDHGGVAFAREYDIERKWREIRLYQTAPISTNLILPISASTCSSCQGRTEHVKHRVR